VSAVSCLTRTLAAMTVSTATLSLVASPASAQSAVSYVAFGDSYASGVGAGTAISSSGSCDRFSGAYPALWAAANNPASFDFAACSGATISDVQSLELPALSQATTLVSVTVGGDDADFTSVLETCNTSSTSSCLAAIAQAEATVTADMPAALDGLLSAIKSDAPNATVVILDYPDFYDLSNSSSCFAFDGLSTTDRTSIDQGIDLVDGLLQTAAAKNGDVFADVRPAFTGHEICDSDSWLNAINLFDLSSSYHPTLAGQTDGYLAALTAAVAHAGPRARLRRHDREDRHP